MKWTLLGVLAISACASHGGAGDTTGGLQNGDGGVRPGEKCGVEAACSSSSSKTYKLCTVAGPPCAARYLASDGQSFNCTTCTDCQAANGLIAGWCGPDDSMCKTQGMNDCISCCQDAHKSGNDLYTMTYQKCLCDNPGDCAADCGSDFCSTGTISDLFCQFCIQQSTCDPSTKCMADPDCSKLLDCVNACPTM
jgi:hypothetical protein